MSYIIGALLFNLVAHLVLSQEVAMALRLPVPSLDSGSIGAGLAWGAPGMLAIAAIEQWRCSECSVAEEDAGECVRCATLTNPILVGTAPLAMVSKAALGVNVGERAVEVVLQSESASPVGSGAPAVRSMSIHAGGALASCAWAHGVLQPLVQIALSGAAFRLTVASMMPADASGAGMAMDSALQLLALRHAVPLVATVATAGIVAGAETAAAHLLQPEARATTEAISEELADARSRAARLFAIDAPPDETARRLTAFGELAAGWERSRATVARTDGAASFARSMVAAAAFAASGGSLLAPMIASLGAAEGREEQAPPPAFAATFTLVAVGWACLVRA